MKHLFKLALTVITLFYSINHQAQTKSTALENTLLWEISGNGLTSPSYVYGTIHMICATDYFLSEKVKNAFQSSKKLVLEIDMTDPTELAAMQSMMAAKEPLDKALNAKQFSKLDEILKKTEGLSIEQLNSYSLSAVMSILSMKSFGCADLKFYEMEFVADAKKRNMEIAGLEKIKSQLSTIEKAYTTDEMLSMLAELSIAETTASVNFYKEENIEMLYSQMIDEKLMNKKTKYEMLDKRNREWVTKLPTLMQKESCFIAVGAAHLAGENGVLHLLKKAGYRVRPLLN
ncbi:TraB/GumN family protein [Flavobacterium tegetincola]|uniref:TraB/GumN family protein n=1 Tax=Flavobacterium tegetincola TaxID=150172 RepID=UPI000410ACC5|nr:TraB/GumN family protein [Flavobacterium tegetincola]